MHWYHWVLLAAAAAGSGIVSGLVKAKLDDPVGCVITNNYDEDHKVMLSYTITCNS
jgi:hypothetical protein